MHIGPEFRSAPRVEWEIAQSHKGITPCWDAASKGHANLVRLLIMSRASFDLPDAFQATPLFVAAQENRLECISVLTTARASLDGAMVAGPITVAAQKGADDAVQLLSYIGARLIDKAAPGWPGGPFWHHFPDNKGSVRDPALWERIVRKGGNEGTPESLRERIRMLKKSSVHDPRDGTSW